MGHNIYILCHQLAQHNKDLALLMKLSEDGDPNTNQALQYYANHTAQIEVKNPFQTRRLLDPLTRQSTRHDGSSCPFIAIDCIESKQD